MKIIFAQGNPGPDYSRTRHNVGFMVLDTLADTHSLTWRTDKKFRADITELPVGAGSEKTLLVKPRSFYNDTGPVARAIIDFYKLDPARDLLVIHDELALPFGTIRVREKGSDAGNNGIKSLSNHLSPAYTRLRIGIWNDTRDTRDDADFVLSAFTATEAKQVSDLITTKAVPLVEEFIAGTLRVSSHTTG